MTEHLPGYDAWKTTPPDDGYHAFEKWKDDRANQTMAYEALLTIDTLRDACESATGAALSMDDVREMASKWRNS